MAFTSVGTQLVLTNIKDAKIKVGAAAQADIMGIQSVDITLEAFSQVLEGDSTTLAITAKSAGRAALKFAHAVMDMTVWAALMGDTAPAASGATPNFVNTFTVKSDHVYPEFQFECNCYVQSTLDNSAAIAPAAEVHVKLAHCLLSKPPSISLSGMAEAKPAAIGGFEAQAWTDASTQVLMTMVVNQTAAAINLT